MNATTIGNDLAKHTFSLHGVDRYGKTVFRKTLSRAKLLPFLAQQPACLVGMEACSGAHHWGRHLTALGHQVGIMASRFVAPYRKGGKNDGNDAEAICEAVARPGMRFVLINRSLCRASLRPPSAAKRLCATLTVSRPPEQVGSTVLFGSFSTDLTG
jgi:transposase